MLAGVVRCGRCGRRMDVRYGRADRRPSSVCSTLRSDYGLPLCQSATATEVEAWVAEQVLEVLPPAALEASLGAAAEVEQRRRGAIRHWEQRLERARYEADRAARQDQACAPEDRLVARTLERRWEGALRAVQQLESEFDRFVRSQPRLLGAAERERIRRLAGEV
ncbi:MAG: zinc ribbon domain-containing protein, partial [Planctomycetaceae bacterium]|nr:zinc ribbon domain-containing protein [Planctomycetaceae bacterium]